MKTYLTAIGTATPVHKIPQMQIVKFMSEAAQLEPNEKRRLYHLYKASGIDYRYSVIPDFGRENGEYEFFPNSVGLEPFPSVNERMQLYKKWALPLALESIKSCFNKTSVSASDITHLITVSCTGMYAPGLDIDITKELGLSENTNRTCINFMGCYAAFNALKVADAFCKAQHNANVLIVCVELCTIHYQKSKSWDDILSNALFSDGAAAVIVSSKRPKHSCFSIESFYCDMLHEGNKHMSWSITNVGFQMSLSSYIPDLIKGGIARFTQKLLNRGELALSEIPYVAIHPGGKKIIEAIEEELSLTRSQTSYSYEVLSEFGNMSSASILFVLEKILYSSDKDILHTNTIASFAFGPGLTIESMILEYCIPDKVREIEPPIKSKINEPVDNHVSQ